MEAGTFADAADFGEIVFNCTSGLVSLDALNDAVPDGAKVVKALNTMTAALMVNPSAVPDDHDLFLSGNDAGAKARVTELLRSFGWRVIVDLGDIGGARGMKMILPIWLRLMGTLESPMFNFHIARG